MISEHMSLPANAFRANAGAVILNRAGQVLALERSDVINAWQMPQGGLEGDEEPLEAAWREVREETGIHASRLKLLDEYPEWLVYELPTDKRSGKYGRGQVQKWFLFRFTGDDADIELNAGPSQEFERWRWWSFAEVVAHAVDFRRPVYERLALRFAKYFNG